MEKVKCPVCAEEINKKATKCRFCGEYILNTKNIDKYLKWISLDKKWKVGEINKEKAIIEVYKINSELNLFIFFILLLFFVFPAFLYMLFGHKKVKIFRKILIHQDGTAEVLDKQDLFLANNYNKKD